MLHHGRFDQFRRLGSSQRPPAFSSGRSYHLSYTGIICRDAGRSRTCLGSGCSRPPGRPAPASSIQSQRWDSNPLRPLYESGARPVEHRRLFAAASAGVEPTRPRFRASVPSRGPGQRMIQQRVGSRLRSGTATVTGSHAGPLHHTHHQSRSSISWVTSSNTLPASSR